MISLFLYSCCLAENWKVKQLHSLCEVPTHKQVLPLADQRAALVAILDTTSFSELLA